MPTLLTLRGLKGQSTQRRITEDPKTIGSTLAVAKKESHPFVVFTNADTGKEESFDPLRVISFVAE
jgi:hypothetical protein